MCLYVVLLVNKSQYWLVWKLKATYILKPFVTLQDKWLRHEKSCFLMRNKSDLVMKNLSVLVLLDSTQPKISTLPAHSLVIVPKLCQSFLSRNFYKISHWNRQWHISVFELCHRPKKIENIFGSFVTWLTVL